MEELDKGWKESQRIYNSGINRTAQLSIHRHQKYVEDSARNSSGDLRALKWFTFLQISGDIARLRSLSPFDSLLGLA
jgi:hypothetical protein